MSTSKELNSTRSRSIPQTLSETPNLNIIRVRHTSWASTFNWWQRYLRPWKIYISKQLSYFSISFVATQLLRLLRPRSSLTTTSSVSPSQNRPSPGTPKGQPQQWKLPIGNVDLDHFMNPGEISGSREWKHEETGWNMAVISPPRMMEFKDDEEKGREVKSKRWMMYFYGGGFLAPMCVSISNLAAFSNLKPSSHICIVACRRTKFHWWYISWLSRELDAEIVVVPYPLGPANSHEDILPQLIKIYADFMNMADGRETIVAGDRCTFRISYL